MKKLFLMGRSEAGKTSLTQILNGEELHYHKTQYTNTGADIIDSPFANVPMVRSWMVNSGCERIFEVSNLTRAGIAELLDYLKDDPVPLTMEEAKERQRRGIPEWHAPAEGEREKNALRRA